jgi:small conductance mechanosensitive channel
MQSLTELRAQWEQLMPNGTPAIVLVVFIAILGYVMSRVASAAAAGVLNKSKLSQAVVRFGSAAARWLVGSFTLLAALEQLGVETSSVVAVLASAGLAVGLALQGSLGHFANGLLLLIFRPFDLGDVVEIGGKLGTVTEMGVFGVTLTTPDNQKVVVPNTVASSATMVNLTTLGSRRADLKVGVAYGTPMAQVEQVITGALRGAPFVDPTQPIDVLLADFGESALIIEVRAWCPSMDEPGVRAEMRKAIYAALSEAKIEVPFPRLIVTQTKG